MWRNWVSGTQRKLCKKSDQIIHASQRFKTYLVYQTGHYFLLDLLVHELTDYSFLLQIKYRYVAIKPIRNLTSPKTKLKSTVLSNAIPIRRTNLPINNNFSRVGENDHINRPTDTERKFQWSQPLYQLLLRAIATATLTVFPKKAPEQLLSWVVWIRLFSLPTICCQPL